MSLQFSDTSNYRGILQIYEKEIGVDQGYVTGNTARLKHVTADVNLAWDDYLRIAFSAEGRWQFDDSNHTDYPIITTNLVSGQRDYSFTSDENGHLILQLYKLLVLPSADATLYQEIHPVDVQKGDAPHIWEGNTSTGTPQQYDKTANGIFLDPTPGYNATNGLKIYINREASYFTTSDTTKKPGCPGLHHRYFAIRPALEYARRNSLATTNSLFNEVMKMERDIEKFFSKRAKDERTIITHKKINYV
jgi:hypothetical protein